MRRYLEPAGAGSCWMCRGGGRRKRKVGDDGEWEGGGGQWTEHARNTSRPTCLRRTPPGRFEMRYPTWIGVVTSKPLVGGWELTLVPCKELGAFITRLDRFRYGYKEWRVYKLANNIRRRQQYRGPRAYYCRLSAHTTRWQSLRQCWYHLCCTIKLVSARMPGSTGYKRLLGRLDRVL